MCYLHQRAAFTSVCLQFAIEQIAAHVHDIFLFLVSDSLALQVGFWGGGVKGTFRLYCKGYPCFVQYPVEKIHVR